MLIMWLDSISRAEYYGVYYAALMFSYVRFQQETQYQITNWLHSHMIWTAFLIQKFVSTLLQFIEEDGSSYSLASRTIIDNRPSP